jgi:YfiH family protein
MSAAGILTAEWPAIPGVVAGCTVRGGGVSRGQYESLNLGTHVGDDAQKVEENRRRFMAAAELPQPPAWLRQVHGSRVAIDPGPGTEADAILTRRTGAVCAVLTADCLPVVFAAQDGSEVAVAHAGWRGLCAGILEGTVAAFSAPPASILAWLGPAISQPAFEVGGEVRDAFLAHSGEARACFERNDAGKWQADLYALARQRLAAAGIGSVHGGGRCTFGESGQFFSYRRDGQCGRMATFVFRTA